MVMMQQNCIRWQPRMHEEQLPAKALHPAKEPGSAALARRRCVRGRQYTDHFASGLTSSTALMGFGIAGMLRANVRVAAYPDTCAWQHSLCALKHPVLYLTLPRTHPMTAISAQHLVSQVPVQQRRRTQPPYRGV